MRNAYSVIREFRNGSVSSVCCIDQRSRCKGQNYKVFGQVRSQHTHADHDGMIMPEVVSKMMHVESLDGFAKDIGGDANFYACFMAMHESAGRIVEKRGMS